MTPVPLPTTSDGRACVAFIAEDHIHFDNDTGRGVAQVYAYKGAHAHYPFPGVVSIWRFDVDTMCQLNREILQEGHALADRDLTLTLETAKDLPTDTGIEPPDYWRVHRLGSAEWKDGRTRDRILSEWHQESVSPDQLVEMV